MAQARVAARAAKLLARDTGDERAHRFSEAGHIQRRISPWIRQHIIPVRAAQGGAPFGGAGHGNGPTRNANFRYTLAAAIQERRGLVEQADGGAAFHSASRGREHCAPQLRSPPSRHAPLATRHRCGMPQERMLRRVVRRWAAGALFKMFRQWAAVTSAAKRYAAVLRKVVARWSKGALWKALVMWKTAVADLVRLIIVAHRIIGKMQCRLLAGAFLRWSEQSSEQKRIMDGARKILGRWRKRMGGQAWLQWCFRVERRARLADIATRIILRWQMAQVYPYLEVDICMWSASFCLLRLPLYGVAFPPVSGLTL